MIELQRHSWVQSPFCSTLSGSETNQRRPHSTYGLLSQPCLFYLHTVLRNLFFWSCLFVALGQEIYPLRAKVYSNAQSYNSVQKLAKTQNAGPVWGTDGCSVVAFGYVLEHQFCTSCENLKVIGPKILE